MTGNTTKVALKDATRKQLRAFATTRLGLPLGNLDTVGVILAKIAQVWDKDYIEVGDIGPEADPAAPKAAARADGKMTQEERDARDAEWFEIEIPVSEAPGGGEPVYVNVNGTGLRIERGRTQWVRYPFIHALQNAVQTLYRQEDPKVPMEPYEAKSYPFQVLRRGLTREDVAPLIKAFHEERVTRR